MIEVYLININIFLVSFLFVVYLRTGYKNCTFAKRCKKGKSKENSYKKVTKLASNRQ